MNELLNSHYNELYHHGVKGMKWGVRRYQNKDGSLTDAGKKRLSDKIVRTMSKNPTKYPGDMVDTFMRNPFIKRAHSELTNARKDLDEIAAFKSNFDKNPKLVNAYRQKAANRFGKEHGYSKEDIEDLLNSMINDDQDFGNAYSFAEYCRANNTSDDAYYTKRNKAETQYYEACKKYTDTLLGEYGDRTAWEKNTSTTTYHTSVSEIVANTLRRMAEKD